MATLGLGPLILLLLTLLPVHARPSDVDAPISLQDLKYKINFHPSESPVLATSGQETIVMTDRDGMKFRCNIPVPESTKAANKDEVQQNATTSANLVADEWSSRKTPEDLLEVFKNKCFRRYEGWWIYELCYKGHLRQFHLHDKKAPINTYGPDMQLGPVVYFTLVKQPSTVDSRTPRRMIVQEFVLGTFDPEATAELHSNSPNISLQKDPRSQNAAQRYHAHLYTNGTICDLTNQPRETEVRFVCSETGRTLINSIKEAPTCNYTLVFHAPILCKHPAFQEERQPWVVIDCNSIPSDKVSIKKDTASGHQSGTEAQDGILSSALPENVNEAPLLSLPQSDAIPLSHTSRESEGETEVVEVPVKSLEEIETHKGITNPSQMTQKSEEHAALPEGDAESKEEGEGTTEELALPGHQREEHPTA